jgi:putative protease
MSEESAGKRSFFLGTEVATRDQIESIDIAVFDRIYLGNPYCIEFKNNLLANTVELSGAIQSVRDSGSLPVVSLIAMPSQEQLPLVDDLIEAGLSAGAAGFEVHSAGTLYHLSKCNLPPDLMVVAGGFSNIYTRRTADLFADVSATLLMPNYELPFEAIDSISASANIPLELLVHGKIPLGLSESCLLVERSSDLGTTCPESCIDGVWLEFDRWSLRSLGKLTCSGKDLCLLPQLGKLWERGYRHFRISGLSEEGNALTKIGQAYRDSLERLDKGQPVELSKLEQLRAFSKYGFCNGYFFGKSGCEWVEEPKQSNVCC